MKSRILPLAALVCLAFVRFAAADDATRLAEAMGLMREGAWTKALAAAGPDDTVPRDVIQWHRLRAGYGTVSEVTDFLTRRSDWPGLSWLRRKSEPIMASAGNERILAYYADQPPQTAEGVLSHAEALIAGGDEGDGQAELVLAWRTMAMGQSQHTRFMDKHHKILAPHHTARLDRMLWDGNMSDAKRMLPLVDDGVRALAEARIALRNMAPGVDTRIAAVPKALRDSPGLAYDRFVWRDRKGRDEDAIKLLLERSSSAELLGEPDKWGRRRVNLARQEMRSGDPAQAYRIAAHHHMTESAGYTYSDLEWTAGFIALRKLNDPATALKHFQLFDASIASPISKGRGGYWIGRAHEALGNKEAALEAYRLGARYQTSFYGLLAAERAELPFDPSLADPKTPPPWRDSEIMSSSVLQAGLILLAIDELALAERFLTHFVESLDQDAAQQVGEMLIEFGHPHLAVMVAKRAARQAVVLPRSYFPMHPVAELQLPMAPEMTLAIARRESEFDPGVVSGAGARGLMQVMPKTARAVAVDLGILGGHSTDRLTREWRYNAKLGANYLAGLAGVFNGNAVMMAAGYNAGPGRPKQWMERYGDPRGGDVDIVDWIEHIPFDETRNYVMRVAESLPIYRARLGKDPLPVPFSEELSGSTLRAFAP